MDHVTQVSSTACQANLSGLSITFLTIDRLISLWEGKGPARGGVLLWRSDGKGEGDLSSRTYNAAIRPDSVTQFTSSSERAKVLGVTQSLWLVKANCKPLAVVINYRQKVARMETGTPPSTPEPDRQKNVHLVNGGRDLDFVPEDSNLSAGEQDPCLPAASNSKPATIAERQPSTSKDEADNKQTLIGSNDSIGGKKKRNSYDRTRPKLASRIESRMRERTGLSRLGLIVAALLVFLLFVFLIVIIVLASTWPRKTHVELSPICRTSPCLMASAQFALQCIMARHTACELLRHRGGFCFTFSANLNVSTSVAIPQFMIQIKTYLYGIVRFTVPATWGLTVVRMGRKEGGTASTPTDFSYEPPLVLMAEDESDLQNALNRVSVVTGRLVLRINVYKTKASPAHAQVTQAHTIRDPNIYTGIYPAHAQLQSRFFDLMAVLAVDYFYKKLREPESQKFLASVTASCYHWDLAVPLHLHHTPSKKRLPSTITPELALREQQCSPYLAVPPSFPSPFYVCTRTTAKHHHTPSKKRLPSTITPELALREQQCSPYLAVPPSFPSPFYVCTRTTAKHHHRVLLPVRAMSFSTNYANGIGIGKVEYIESEPSFSWRGSGENYLGKTTPSSPDRDSNFDIPVLGSPVQYETSALTDYATQAGMFMSGSTLSLISKVTTHQGFPSARLMRPLPLLITQTSVKHGFDGTKPVPLCASLEYKGVRSDQDTRGCAADAQGVLLLYRNRRVIGVGKERCDLPSSTQAAIGRAGVNIVATRCVPPGSDMGDSTLCSELEFDVVR
uniref:Uncharacterized protein n=1 Tax=Timema shepardi TaxID=629360 RepID=A0A7R9ALC5_TIMSH|nr:unnamed protein product [Timema shepardi]